MNPNETIEIPFEINNLSNGLHDAMIIIVRDPNNKSLDSKYRATTLVNNLLYFRFSITVNNDIPSNYNITKFEQKHLKDNFNTLVLNKDENSVSPWFKDQLQINNVLHFYTHIGNKDFDESQKYALITLFDWNQIDINNKYVNFVEVNKGKEIDVPMDIKVPNSNGIYNITSIIILNPFQKVNQYNNQVFVSARVGLDVK